MFSSASSSVVPCDQQPGRSGQLTANPSSDGMSSTLYLIPASRLLTDHQRRLAYTLIAIPSTLPKPSSIASARVGWAWMVNIISSTVASSSMAVTASATSSVACGPMMCTPSTSPYFASATTLMNPSCELTMDAFEFAEKGNLPTFT